MALSNEWFEWHLTATGWAIGTQKTDFALDKLAPPKDRVASYRFQEYLASRYSKAEFSWTELWVDSDAPVSELKEKFGEYPNSHIKAQLSGIPISWDVSKT